MSRLPTPPSRRSFLGQLAGATAAAGIVHGCTDLSAAPAPNPDAELIHLCAAYIEAMAIYNADGGSLEAAKDPLWHAVDALADRLDGMIAHTLEGIIAKARVAQFLACAPDGSFDFDTEYTGDWPEQVVRDLLSLQGHAP